MKKTNTTIFRAMHGQVFFKTVKAWFQPEKMFSLLINVEQQKKILAIGACLTCHDEESKVMIESLNGFDDLVLRCSKECILPDQGTQNR